MLREDFPWIYELGMEAYRISLNGNSDIAQKAQHRFADACRALRRGPFLDMLGDKESYVHLREMIHFLERDEMFTEADEASGSVSVRRRQQKSNP